MGKGLRVGGSLEGGEVPHRTFIRAYCRPHRSALLRHERHVLVPVAAQVSGQNAGLDERHLGDPQALVEQRMGQRLLLTFLVGLDHPLAPGVGELDCSTLALEREFWSFPATI